MHHAKPSALSGIVARVRRMFDVDADPLAINTHLRRSALLKPLVRRWPGQRLPNAWDGFELAVRAILGQQVSVAAARTLAARIAARHGTAFPEGAAVGLHNLFPSPELLVDAPLEEIGVMRARADAIRTLARAVVDGSVHFRTEQTLAAFEESLVALPGIGPWTAHYVAMRALGQPDAFPAADLILRRAAGEGVTLSTRATEAMSEAWRPWRVVRGDVVVAQSELTSAAVEVFVAFLAATFDRIEKVNAMFYDFFDSPIGPLVLVSDDDGALIQLHLPKGGEPGHVAPEWKRAPARLRETRAQIAAYFAGKLLTFDFRWLRAARNSSAWSGTSCCAIPYGDTISYADLAAASASRARCARSARRTAPIRSR